MALAACAARAQVTVSLTYDRDVPQVTFAAGEIRRACAARGWRLAEQGPAEARWRIALNVRGGGAAQSYSIRRDGAAIEVAGADAAGAMYGGLDIAEAIRLGTIEDLANSTHAPHVERRGIKFNIPLDARTPSYSDNSDAAQLNIPEMWSFDFWREFLDEMARRRYNVLSLWSLHPFPSLVKVPEFPDVALEDVMRTTAPIDDTFSHTGSDMVRPVMLERLETVKKMSIEDKIGFWREVMRYARDRGIEVYLFTWNIFTFGAEPKYGITPAQDNAKTIEYFRASVRETVLTYPLLAGIGITAGEQMQERKDEFSKEKWLWKTYGEGIRDALALQPGRDVRLIHRFHQTSLTEILDAWKAYPGTFDLSFKYAIAHMYSIPNPPFIEPVLGELSPRRRTWLTVRDDDIYSFRWGDPEYARAFIRAMPGKDKVAGFYMGPDGTIWGREALSTEPETPRELVISKRWYSFMLWGRLSYEPSLPDSLFERTLAARFPEVPAEKLARAWAQASRVFPMITRFMWGDIDLRWFPEACLSHPRHKGYYTVRHFIEGETMPGSGVLNILDWRGRLLNNKPMEGTTPLEIASALEAQAGAALALLPELRAKGGSKELRLTLGDIEAMSHLGNYYAAKIRGAASLALFDRTGNAEQRAEAVKQLQSALAHWRRYAEVYSRQYKPQLLNRVGYVNIPSLTVMAEKDVQTARAWRAGTIDEKNVPRAGADRPFTR
jgi:hypothetical protein